MADRYALERLLLLALSDDRYRRRLIGRLRPAVTGWHYPRRRMARLPWQVIRLLPIRSKLSYDTGTGAACSTHTPNHDSLPPPCPWP
jgi:hypothetical protein